MAGGG
ncbi:hypothetical protein YPPY13_4941, partial [Yersinia pestis PY-13]